MTPINTPQIHDDFTEYLELLSQVLTDKDQRASFALYVMGLLSPLPRKSVEPIAAMCCCHEEEVSALHQRLLHFLANTDWNNEAVRRIAAGYALGPMTEHGPIEVSIVDDTGFLKQGKHSVGTQHQYTGSAGKVTNCQLGVSLTIATAFAHLPLDMQLYLPECWMQDTERRKQAKIPDDLPFRTKPQIAMEMLLSAHAAGISLGIVIADAAYGTCGEFRAFVRGLLRHYMVGVNSTLLISVMDRKRGLLLPQSLAKLTQNLKPKQFRLYRWREGSKGVMQGLFAILRVRVPDDTVDDTLWLLVEKTGEKKQPYKYYLSSLPAHTPRLRLVDLAKARWRTEQMYLECKEELGLDHYEGRSYPGWNHHVSAVLASYALVVARRERAFPPAERNPKKMERSQQRKQRHQPASIATTCLLFGRALLAWLPQCPHCHHAADPPHRAPTSTGWRRPMRR
jgi:SRSO17 transposase